MNVHSGSKRSSGVSPGFPEYQPPTSLEALVYAETTYKRIHLFLNTVLEGIEDDVAAGEVESDEFLEEIIMLIELAVKQIEEDVLEVEPGQIEQ